MISVVTGGDAGDGFDAVAPRPAPDDPGDEMRVGPPNVAPARVAVPRLTPGYEGLAARVRGDTSNVGRFALNASTSRERGRERGIDGEVDGLPANRVRGNALRAAAVSEPSFLPLWVRPPHLVGTNGCPGSVVGESTGVTVGV